MIKEFNQPLGGNAMARAGGPATMMRLPVQKNVSGLDACFVGPLPLDIGSSNRVGSRDAPRQIRAESSMIRPYNMGTGAAPFDSIQVAGIGDVAVTTFNLTKNIDIIERFFDDILGHDCIPLTPGGDHTVTLPILRAMATKLGPVGLVHVDAHTDINDEMFSEKIAHGTVFRRAVEEELIDSSREVQIGVRGSGYAADDFDWGVKSGVPGGAGRAVLAQIPDADDGGGAAG
ncbi:Arginase family protein [Desulforhopalus singaporensis]|uniref:Arginase family protein n=1 Tax=Desulforhopalus singaporensis TaxID=91360 RepID=A0A1H0SL09_9BACT|nr:arginase family protein [Desulforhopalus singaporensis]SDP42219.1 Arginase family protein [Desulforhopalus singaporensis]